MNTGDTVLYYNEDPKEAKLGVILNIHHFESGQIVYRVKDNWYLNAIKASTVELLYKKII